jgi:HK97 family phage portal protein
VGLIRSAARAFARASSGPTSGIATPERWVEDWFAGGGRSAAGVCVTPETALYYAPFFSGLRVIAEDVGSLPLKLYERLERGKTEARTHPLYNVLRYQANPMMTAQALRETLTGHAISWGFGVAQIVTDPRNGAIAELWPLRPDRTRVCVKRMTGGRFTRVFEYCDDVNGIYATLLPEEVLFVPGLGFDGVRGYPVVELAANSIGLGLATEMHGAKVFSNGSAPGGALTHPGVLSDGARTRMQAGWEDIHRSIDNAHRVAILEEGVTWQAVGMPNDAAQFLETRKLQVTEMARWLRLPSYKINDLERATFSNIEQTALDYVATSLRTWLVRWEEAVFTQLLTPPEQETYFAEHLLDAMLRGDTLSRYQAYNIGRQGGWLSANDIREKENENPVDGGDVYLVPLNMVPADQVADPGPAPAAGEEAPRAAGRARARALARGEAARRKTAAKWAPRIADADAELLVDEVTRVTALAAEHLPAPDDGEERGRRSLQGFVAAITTYYEQTVQESTLASWLPLFGGHAQAIGLDAARQVGHEDEVDLSTWVRAYTLSHVAYRVATSIGQLRNAAEKAEPGGEATAIAARLAKWQAERPGQTSAWQTAQLPNAAARETWKEAGVETLAWVTSGKSDCPHCSRMDGRTVAIDAPFVAKGGSAPGGDDTKPMAIHHDTFHPPLHPGCDCSVEPE